ncbi:MAG: sensor histidine kinase, partial [Rhodobacteraceae bacterium]|nr:sensor histidine kinase [Paracoccaceae bacterium]
MVRVFRNRIVMVVAFLALVAGFAGGLRWYAYGQALDQLNQRGQSDLALASDRLTGALQRYRELAVLLADHPAVSVALANPDLAQGGMRQILEVADKSGSLNIVIVDPTGQEVLSAREVVPRSHFAEPDFQRAMDGALGLAHRWDDQFDQRVFAFAAPVFSASGPVRGVVIVTVDVEAI